MTDRARARELAAGAVSDADPSAWFEVLYREAERGTAVVPWADLEPNPLLVRWMSTEGPRGGRALDVGCGYGDNAAYLRHRGFDVDAFDVSPTAIERARQRFGDVRFTIGDALAPPPEWRGAFDLVVEVYTLQVHREGARRALGAALTELLAPGGTLLVIARLRDEDDPVGSMPWPLTRGEIEAIASADVPLTSFEELLDDEDPPVRRAIATYTRSGG
ncbi:MAG: methyltransferase domain-containing protein [Sandaracinaceae bacterium]